MADFKQLEERLVRSFMSGWQRRGCSILQVGLHSYLSPDFFWDAGFDVCATDENLHALNYALDSSGPRVEYRLAKVDFLPFDDDSFDYAFFTCYASPHYRIMKEMKAIDKEQEMGKSVLVKEKAETSDYENSVAEKQENETLENGKLGIKKAKNLGGDIENSVLHAKTEKKVKGQDTRTDSEQNPESIPTFLENSSFESLFGKNLGDVSGESNIFSETCRVAQRGVIILCKNSLSVRRLPASGNKINPWSLWRKVKKAFPQGEVRIMTSLALPRFIKKRFNLVDVHSHVLPCGDFLGIRVNFNAPVVTGLGVLSKATIKKKLVEEPIVNRANARNK